MVKLGGKSTNSRKRSSDVIINTENDTDYDKVTSNPIFDCGCTAHMWNHRSHFTTYTPFHNRRMKAAVADGHQIDILGKGDIGPLKDVLYVPQLQHCLISASALLDQGFNPLNFTRIAPE